MKLSERIGVLIQLGEHLQQKDEYLEALMSRTSFQNPWFTIENQKMAVAAIASAFLSQEKIEAWIDNYTFSTHLTSQRVGLVLAGNIPMVGFHDLLCCFVAGHHAVIKLSEKDKFLIPYLIQRLVSFDKRCQDYFKIVEKLTNFDAVIATGSNNTARYFEAYFGKYPNIIRKNRTAVALLTGDEQETDLLDLGKDVFQYFGLGCRNVSKLYVPEGYNFTSLLEALHTNNRIVLNSKYKNNFDYSFALYTINRRPFLSNGCVLLLNDTKIQSRIACLHYEFYHNLEEVIPQLNQQAAEIQCVVSGHQSELISTIPFGKAQKPALEDYADGVDTMAFLLAL